MVDAGGLVDEIVTAPGKRGSRAICMPVGPAGIKNDTAQLLIGLIKMGACDAFFAHESHIIPARNAVWATAIEYGVSRVLWIDADIYADPTAVRDFMNRADRSMSEDSAIAWIGAVCKRRGGGLAMVESKAHEHYPLLMGLGLAYWDVARMQRAIGKDAAFVWVPPFGEDYRACISVWDADLKVVVDRKLPTTHIGVGDWEGES